MSLNEEEPLPEFTPEELALFKATDDELKRRAFTQSFDQDGLTSRIKGDRFNKILHAHLHFDHVITLLLIESFKRPKAIDLDRIGFSQKLQLANALALIPSDIVPSVRHLNTLRNRMAHQLNVELTDQDVEDLFAKLPNSLKSEVQESEKLYEWHERLTVVLIHMIFTVEHFRQANAHRRFEMKRHMLRVRSLLKRLDRERGELRQ